MFQLRKSSRQDEAFLYQLYVSTRKREFELLGLQEQEMDALLRMQFEAQKSSYQTQFPQANYHLITTDCNVPVGRIITQLQESELRLIDISILPAYRAKGIGTTFLRELQKLASKKNIPLTLHVLAANPAKRLYERCGFYETSRNEPYASMRWDPIK